VCLGASFYPLTMIPIGNKSEADHRRKIPLGPYQAGAQIPGPRTGTARRRMQPGAGASWLNSSAATDLHCSPLLSPSLVASRHSSSRQRSSGYSEVRVNPRIFLLTESFLERSLGADGSVQEISPRFTLESRAFASFGRFRISRGSLLLRASNQVKSERMPI
jgi:hypothetical protein